MMQAAEQTYREQVVQEYRALTFAGFGAAAPRLDQIRLDQIFVHLRLTTEQDEPRLHRKADAERAAKADNRVATAPDTPISLVDALGKPLLLVGDPGAGKSTLLRWLAVTLAQGRQRDPDRLGPAADADRLPLLLELGRLPTPYLTDDSRQLPDWETLLPDELCKQAPFRHTPLELLRQALAEGRCLLLFDGLDEVANRQARARLAQSLAQVPRLFPGNRVVVGSRPAGLTGESEGALRPTFQRCQIQRFTPDDLQAFFRFWYAVLAPKRSPEEQQREADTLYDQIQAAPGTLSLAGTPLLATLLLLLGQKDRTLPERRVDLYERCCQMLVDEWERSHQIAYQGIFVDLGWEQHLRLLAPIAYHIHSQKEREYIDQDELQHLLEEGLQARKLCSGETAGLEAGRFLETLALRSGLLQFQGDGQFGFPHLTFQEYLAARHLAPPPLAGQPDPMPINEVIKKVMEHLHEDWWQEVHLLTIGRLGSGKQGAARAAALLKAILQRYRPPSRLLRSSRRWWLRLIAPGRWLPGVQLARRLAWLLRREEMFALWGAAECAPAGLPATLRDDLAARAAALTRAMLADEARRPLLDTWLSAPGRHPPTQASRAIAQPLLAALRDDNGSVRWRAAQSLGQVGSGQPEVTAALLAALRDAEWLVRRAAAESLGQVGSGQPEVTAALLAALRDADSWVRGAAAESLGQMKITDVAQLRQALVALNQRLYALDEDDRSDALAAITVLVAGRALPGSPWKPVGPRRPVGRLLAVALVTVAVVLGLAWLLGIPLFSSLVTGLGSAIGLIVGVAALVGLARNLWNRWNRPRNQQGV